jgi:Glycosyl transferase family 11
MIRVVLQGRTGNNFFQYAAARWLAMKHHTDVVLDGSWLRPRNWAQTRVMKGLALQAPVKRWPLWIGPALRAGAGKHPAEFTTKSVYRENSLDSSFDPAFQDLPDGSLLIGYFQSPLFFPGMRPILQKEINYRDMPMDHDTTATARRISSENSVSIHVRRGDFIHYKNFAVCTPRYFDLAVALAKNKLSSPTFWIFSDDIPWCRSHFTGPEFRFVDLPESQRNPLNDMRLMSLASHHIISNSSYSWWGAWLHWTPEKLVITPHLWHLGTTRMPVEEKIEKEWIIIDSGVGHHATPSL